MIGFHSISSRFTGFAMVFILAASVTAGIIGGGLALDYTEKRFHDNFRLLSDYLAKNTELGLLLKDRDMLKALADNMLALDDIKKVTILDMEDIPLVSVYADRKDEKLVSLKTRVKLSADETGDLFLSAAKKKRFLGSVIVAYSLESLEKLQARMVYFFSGFVLIFVVVSYISFLLLSRSVVQPLKQILKVSKTVSRGDMNIRADTGLQGTSLKEVTTLAAGFNKMLDDLRYQKDKAEKASLEMSRQKALAEVGRFSMMVAHEVKNPLSVIKGSLDILKKNSIDPLVKKEMIMYVEEDIKRINKIVEDFLLFAGPGEPDFSDTDMNAYTASLVDKFSFQTPDTNVQKKIEQTPAWCRCDRAKMDRAVANILHNAAGFADSEILVSTYSQDNKWHLLIEDDGPGIADNAFDKIFEPFYTKRTKGTGLGLTITKDVIDMHNASVNASGRQAGTGTRFEIVMEKIQHGIDSGSR